MSVRGFGPWQPQIGADVYLDPTALVIGRVVLGAEVSVWPYVVIRGDVNRIEIGARSNIQDGSVLHVTHDSVYQPGGLPLLIGEEVTVGHQVTLHACTLGSRCLIGMGSIILDGANVPEGTWIAAGSLVPPHKSLEGGYLWQGRPAVRVRPLSDSEQDYLKYLADQYVKLAQQYQEGLDVGETGLGTNASSGVI